MSTSSRRVICKAALITVIAGVVIPALPSFAQTSTPSSYLQLHDGELRLDGKITAVTGANEWSIAAESWTSPRGVVKKLEEPRPKSIKLVPGGFVMRSGGEIVRPQELRLGFPISALGANQPDGSVLARIVILKSPDDSGGKIRVSANVLSLLRQADAAQKSGQNDLAISKYRDAVSIAGGQRDSAGEGLAWTQLAALYQELNQPQKAVEAYGRAFDVARVLGDGLAQATAQNSIGLVYDSMEKREDAIKAYEEAVRLSSETVPVAQRPFLNNLLQAYLAKNDRTKALPIAEKLLSIIEIHGEPEDVMEAQLAWLDLIPPDQKDRQNAGVTRIRTSIARGKSPSMRAKFWGQLAWIQISMKNVPEAINDYTKAAEDCEAAGNKNAASHLRRQIKKLQDQMAQPQPLTVISPPTPQN